MMGFIKKIKDFIKVPYYYVGQCPHCGSYITGHYIKAYRRTETEWQIDEALKHGEIVRPKAELIGANCFCLECDNDFSYPVQTKMISLSQMEKEKIRRHTNDFLSERMRDEYHQKNRGPLAMFINFVGKL